MVGRRGCVIASLLLASVLGLSLLFVKRHSLLYYANIGDFRVTVESNKARVGGSKWENFPPSDGANGRAQESLPSGPETADLDQTGDNAQFSAVQRGPQPLAINQQAGRKAELHRKQGVAANQQLPAQSKLPNQNRASKEAALEAGQQPANVIEARIRQLGDMRSPECAAEKYDGATEAKVTIIIDFNDYQFYSVKSVLGSVVAAGMERVAEIVVVDDGTSLPYIIDESVRYIATLPMARLVRRPTQSGPLRARASALSSSTLSDTIIFLDHNVIVSRGWIEPLLDLLSKEPRVIAVPHYDHITDPVTMEYRKTPTNVIATWTWDMAVRMRHSDDSRILSSTQFVVSPALRGNAFAVRKSEFKKLGGLDERLEEGGGEYLDLSLRAWMCGGGVKIASCSRVAIISLEVPVRVRTRRNMRKIADAWFGDRADAVIQLNGGSILAVGGANKANKSPAGDRAKCQNLKWYLKEIKNDTHAPTVYSAHFGTLRVHSGRCARVGADFRIDLDPCGADFSASEPWEMTRGGRIRTPDGRCLTTAMSAYLVAEPCRMNTTRQDWMLTDRQELVNVWSGYCARHVTDPDRNTTARQIAMAQVCHDQPQQNDQFKRWSFIPHG